MATAPKITVITCSIRPEGIPLVEQALKKQTFRDFTWIVQGRDGDLPKGCVWTLNRDYNTALKKADGELIVSWQDWTSARPDTLERFWRHYEAEPRTLVGAVGHKYADPSWQVMTWKDPRATDQYGSYYPCYFSDIEWNLCAVPRQAIDAVGGFDEELDRWYGMDGYSVNCRIHLLGGYDFKLDQTIQSYSLEHGRPTNWEAQNALHGPYQERAKRYLENPVLPYLTPQLANPN